MRSKKSFKDWQKSKRERVERRQQLSSYITTTQWLEYVGACNFNQKLGKNWSNEIFHDKPPSVGVKSVETNKDPLQSKTQRRKNNCKAAKLHEEAKKKFDEENAQEPKKVLHLAPDRFNFFTVGDR